MEKKFLIGGIIVFLTIGYLVFMGLQGSVTYYYTVSELMEQGSSIYDENVRVKGQIAPGSVEQEVEGRILRFAISDGENTLPVTYHGAVPDTFKIGAEVVVEGQFNSNGIFQAHTLMPKCPSRYVPQQ